MYKDVCEIWKPVFQKIRSFTYGLSWEIMEIPTSAKRKWKVLNCWLCKSTPHMSNMCFLYVGFTTTGRKYYSYATCQHTHSTVTYLLVNISKSTIPSFAISKLSDTCKGKLPNWIVTECTYTLSLWFSKSSLKNKAKKQSIFQLFTVDERCMSYACFCMLNHNGWY